LEKIKELELKYEIIDGMFKDSKTRNEQLYSKKIIELNTKIETLENQIKTTNGNIQKLNLEVKKNKNNRKIQFNTKKRRRKEKCYS